MSSDEGAGEDGDVHISMFAPPEKMAGVWANFARVGHSPYEFTIDFCRLDFDGDTPIGGILVERVNMSPLFIRQLIDALNSNWDKYAEKALPPEVRDRGSDDEHD